MQKRRVLAREIKSFFRVSIVLSFSFFLSRTRAMLQKRRTTANESEIDENEDDDFQQKSEKKKTQPPPLLSLSLDFETFQLSFFLLQLRWRVAEASETAAAAGYANAQKRGRGYPPLKRGPACPWRERAWASGAPPLLRGLGPRVVLGASAGRRRATLKKKTKKSELKKVKERNKKRDEAHGEKKCVLR